MKKSYVIAPYCHSADELVLAMYESDDFRLKGVTGVINGEFKRTKEFKGKQNGFEIGVFNGSDGNQYLIFSDYTANRM